VTGQPSLERAEGRIRLVIRIAGGIGGATAHAFETLTDMTRARVDDAEHRARLIARNATRPHPGAERQRGAAALHASPAADSITGDVLPPLTRGYLERPGAHDHVVSKIPIGRLAEARDIVGAAIFLASDAASFMVGQTIFVDGGRTL
jgi:Enoyl-(Acyl carrier protein) reductase